MTLVHSKPRLFWSPDKPFRQRQPRLGWRRLLSATLALAAWLSIPNTGAMAADSMDAVTTTAVQRFYISQINDRCHLLDPATTQGLKAGFIQARNAAIRNGDSMSDLGPWLDRARDAAASADCASPQLAAEIATVQRAFHYFQTQLNLDLPTGRTSWTGNRAFDTIATWRLVQYQHSPDADVALGLYGSVSDNRFSVMAKFADDTRPYSAHLLIRDPGTQGVGIINPAAYTVSNTMPYGFSEDSDLSFRARASSEATVNLSPVVKVNFAGFSASGAHVGDQSPVDAIRFDFSTRAYRAIAQLDPREDIVVVFDFAGGPRYARFEVGDFITGMTYIALPSPYTH
jgi:hypothetical protein